MYFCIAADGFLLRKIPASRRAAADGGLWRMLPPGRLKLATNISQRPRDRSR
jgi:hypothetical protein